jgi:hypothetical protein
MRVRRVLNQAEAFLDDATRLLSEYPNLTWNSANSRRKGFGSLFGGPEPQDIEHDARDRHCAADFQANILKCLSVLVEVRNYLRREGVMMKNEQLAEYGHELFSGNPSPAEVVMWLRMSIAAMRAKASEIDD